MSDRAKGTEHNDTQLAKTEDWLTHVAQRAYDSAQELIKVQPGDSRVMATSKVSLNLLLQGSAYQKRVASQFDEGVVTGVVQDRLELAAKTAGGTLLTLVSPEIASGAALVGVGSVEHSLYKKGSQITDMEGAVPLNLVIGSLSVVLDAKTAAGKVLGPQMVPEIYTSQEKAQSNATLQNAGREFTHGAAMVAGGYAAGPAGGASNEALEATTVLGRRIANDFAELGERLQWGGLKPAYEFVPTGTPKIQAKIPDYRDFARSPGLGLTALPVSHMIDSAGGETTGDGGGDNKDKQARKPWEVISHRGRAQGENVDAPGNTLKAFENILAKHPNISVETDVRLTKDGTLIVLHDNFLPFATNGNGFANEVTRSTLRSLRVKTGGVITDQRVPELEDVFKLFNGRGTIHLELKVGPNDPPGLLPRVLDLMEKYPNQSVALSSFDHAALLQVPADVRIGVLSNVMPPDLVKYAEQFTLDGQRSLGNIAFHPDIWNLTAKAMADAHAAGMPINAYTVPKEMFPWTYENGVNPITDHPEAALEFLSHSHQK
jgi:glycerophosphoryl diester phosphodiesterase